MNQTRKSCFCLTRVIIDSPNEKQESSADDATSLDIVEHAFEEEKTSKCGYPLLVCELKDPGRMKTNGKIEITPWTVNKRELKEKFRCVFGRTEVISQNDYNFDDDKIAPRQFEIIYVPEQKKFFFRDLEKSTGIFIRINKSIEVDRELIVSFCNNHFSLNVSQQGAEHKLEVKFMHGLKKNEAAWKLN